MQSVLCFFFAGIVDEPQTKKPVCHFDVLYKHVYTIAKSLIIHCTITIKKYIGR